MTRFPRKLLISTLAAVALTLILVGRATQPGPDPTALPEAVASLGAPSSTPSATAPVIPPTRTVAPTSRSSATPTACPTPLTTATPTSSPTPLLTATPAPSPSPTSTPILLPTLAPRVTLGDFSHEWQTWNNCGPATLAIGLSFYGVERTQADIAAVLKPNVADKNVSLAELLDYAAREGVQARVRVNGTVDLLRRLTNGFIPVLTEGWLTVGEDIGHYRIVRGYDLETDQLLTQDSYHGPNLWVSVEDFEAMWQPFFFAYTPLYRAEQEPLVASIIGADWEDGTMIARALASAQAAVESANENPYAWHNLGDALRLSGDLDGSLSAYEHAVELGLPGRFFWYQFGYFAVLNGLGQHERVLEFTQPLIEEVPSLAEVLVERGHALRSLGRKDEAIAEFEQALLYLSDQDKVLAILADLR